jgi:formate dehydrogenase maturation protein FdhE
MSKNNQRQPQAKPKQQTEPIERTYSPPPCCSCESHRPKQSNYTRVYKTQREEGSIIRYCRCSFCGETWKHIRKA